LNRIILIAMVLLSSLAMAPVVPDEPLEMYLPLTFAGGCPAVSYFVVYSTFNSYHQAHYNVAGVGFRTEYEITIDDAQVYDVETGGGLSSDIKNDQLSEVNHEDGAHIWFDIRDFYDCSLYGVPYQVRFEISNDDGCHYSLAGEFIPEQYGWCDQ
jgi:hypothetical protein